MIVRSTLPKEVSSNSGPESTLLEYIDARVRAAHRNRTAVTANRKDKVSGSGSSDWLETRWQVYYDVARLGRGVRQSHTHAKSMSYWREPEKLACINKRPIGTRKRRYSL